MPHDHLTKIIHTPAAIAFAATVSAAGLPEGEFRNPSVANRPETYVFLIGGNVAKPGIAADFEAIKDAGIAGILLFHGQLGNPWPGVSPQIKCLSESWDGLMRFVADECQRLGLSLSMHNCPGWAMSGGPWIKPENAMRHLIWSRIDVEGGKRVEVKLPTLAPSAPDPRDYRDIAVLAFPATAGEWLDGSAPYPGTYAALVCGSIGGYFKNRQVMNNDRKRTKSVAAQAVIAKRCDTCHTGGNRLPHYLSDENGISFWTPNWNDPRLKKWHRHLLFNLSRPEKSLFLKAPLAKEAGGFGMGKDGKAVFKSTDDPDYKAILAMIQDGKDVLEKVKRFDMPGFRPPKPYLREMKRYGVLPATFDVDKAPVDSYALDRMYWALDWTQLN